MVVKPFKGKVKNKTKLRRLFMWQKILLTLTIVFFLVIATFLLGLIKKTCENADCFKESLRRCSTAKYLQLENFNYYKWTINGKSRNDCEIDIKLVKMAAGTPIDRILQFEGKDMSCRVPLSVLQTTESSKVENILNYCTGPLKEAIYQSIIERLYTVIVANLGTAIKELEKTIKTGAL